MILRPPGSRQLDRVAVDGLLHRLIEWSDEATDIVCLSGVWQARSAALKCCSNVDMLATRLQFIRDDAADIAHLMGSAAGWLYKARERAEAAGEKWGTSAAARLRTMAWLERRALGAPVA